jgi:hypothetical protein
MTWACYRGNIIVSAEGQQMLGVSNLYEETDMILLTKTGFPAVKTIDSALET